MGSKSKAKPRPRSRKRLVSSFRRTTTLPPTTLNNTEPNDNNSGKNDDYINTNSIIDKANLINLMENTICINCHKQWLGSIQCRKREGLYESLEFICSYCEHAVKLPTSKQQTMTQRREINIRAQLGAHLTGIGRSGLEKLCVALNIPPPIDEDHYTATDAYLLDIIQIHQQNSMDLAVKEAVQEASSTNLTVSGDGSWITRGHSSAHGIADICSTTQRPKVIDVERSSKECSQCIGAQSIRKSNTEKYEIFMRSHQCEVNYAGSSGSMERTLIKDMFKRSISKYNVQYHYYIGDGNTKVHKALLDDPTYENVEVQKIEDVNHYSKRLSNRIKKIKTQNKNKILQDGLKIGGAGRLTDQHILKFKMYLGKAIRENLGNLTNMYHSAQVIFYNYYSTDQDPQHQFCDPKWCKYLQDSDTYDHGQHSIPRACMDIVKPAFDELCSKEALKKVVRGGSQNPNETFHGILWHLVPKHRYASGLMIDIGVGLAVILYNDGYKKLRDLFQQLFNSCGYYTNHGIIALDTSKEGDRQKFFGRKRTQKVNEQQTHKIFLDNDDNSSNGEDDESDGYLYSIRSSDEDAYEPGGDDLY
ncbi:unnamed protein product [Rotaria sordida]|uniref:Mutator-like transposase domain-containing protein n=1 Tax=Rotaria sordida TaxID=392033 RepID=A0A819WTX0_9BILA|nr:unnamed protein product [Rotaria sordida]